MPATAIFMVVATVIGAVVVALIIWVTARRHSVGQRFELQLQLQRGTRGTRPPQEPASTKP